jgi:hypothetical protein
MTRSLPIIRALTLGWLGGLCSLSAQVAPPTLSPAEKEAAAAVEAPKTIIPPPLPGQLSGAALGTAAVPVAPLPPAPPSAPAANSASKMEALEAATQAPVLQEAPRVSTPADRLPVTSSTSTSRQFIVHGKVFETRSAMSSRCEEVSSELRKVLNDKEPWALPVVVLLNMGEEATKSKGPPVSTTITEMTHGGFHLQITINDRPGINAEDMRKEIVRALLAERILRNHQQIATPEGRLLLPDWVMTGVMHAMDYKASARPSAMFATIFSSGKIYGIEEIIAASPVEMDGLSRTIYETSCCALVLALVDQPDGGARFNKFLNSLATDPRSERELLDVAFPSFGASASSLNKWWALQLAALSKPGIAEPYTAADSLKAIEDAILIRYEAPAGEAPQNVKLRPFVLPTTPAFTPPPKPAPKKASSGDDPPRETPPASGGLAKSDEEPAAEGEESESEDGKDRRRLWRRLLFLGDPESESVEAAEPAAGEPMPPETVATEAVEEPGKPGFFSRLFGGGGTDEAKPEEPASDAKTKAAEVEKPKTEATPKAEPKVEPKPEPKVETKVEPKVETKPGPDDEPGAEEKKPSKLNPLNWFRGGKQKPNEEPAEKKADAEGEEQSAASLPPALDVTRLISPALADAWQALAPSAPRQTVEPLFNFLKKRSKTGEETKEDEPKKDDAKKDAPSKAGESKPTAKSEAKPRSTNPNAKPIAKKSADAASAPKTTNPNAKPLPTGFVPPVGAAPGTPAPAKNGLVSVVLPLEEYKLILKHPDRATILNYNIATLRALELRVSVLFRPVVTGYLSAVLDLQQGKTKDMDKRLTALREFALIAYQKSVAVRDYLDWFEASESSGLSGKFDDFLNLPSIIEKELPARTDPISKYLDAVDKEFSK